MAENELSTLFIQRSVTGINKAIDKGADASTYGLMDKPKNVWTHKSA